MAKKGCSVLGCKNTNVTEPKVSLFSLPSEDDRRAIWLHLISREELQDKHAHSYVVCEEHFDPASIQGTPGRKRLRRFSVPSLKLPPRRSEDKQTQTEIKENLNKFAQTDFFVLKIEKGAQTANFLTTTLPAVQKVKEELMVCKKQLKLVTSSCLTKNTFHVLCDKFLTKPLAEIVKAQTKLKFHGKGNRYSAKYKQFCINLYYTSPQAYKLLEQALCLPNATTLARHSLPISTEVNEHLMTTLKAKVNNMTNSEKVCSVVVDAINLKTSLFYNINMDKIIGLQEVNGLQSPVLAKKALVVIIRGIFGNWQQPIGFALLGESKNSDDISNWIEQLLEKLIDVGLDIRTPGARGDDSC
ncbi:hypothetical protein PYW07_008480 [Mythimna separata]|uniref:THAP-type domain-containing protein n=1 Tax=Mythimna separata TaxID=271217 RepID=A0AAD7YDT8_MYTSE|nr:hypothetical protein PYW07_008480 [Mythimna separata]